MSCRAVFASPLPRRALALGLALALAVSPVVPAQTEPPEPEPEPPCGGELLEPPVDDRDGYFVNLEEARHSEADLLARLEAARNALELSRIRYESGYSPYLEVLDAQRTANDAEIAFVRNRQARLAFSVDLMRALGGGWKPL